MPEAQLKIVELPFPFNGLHESGAVAAQPPGTTPYAVNVRGYDPAAMRDRGCQRGGIQLYGDDQFSTDRIDYMAKLAVVSFPGEITETLLHTVTASATIGDHILAAPGDSTYVSYEYTVAGTPKRFLAGPHGIAEINLQPLAQPFTTYTLGANVYGDGTAGPYGSLLFELRLAIPNSTTDAAIVVRIYNDGVGASFQDGMTDFSQQSWGGTTSPLGVAFPFTITVTETQVVVAATGRATKTFTNAGTRVWDFDTQTLQPSVQLSQSTIYNGTGGILLTGTGDQTDFDIIAERILYAQNSQVYIGSKTMGFNVVNAAALPGAISYTAGEEVCLLGAEGKFWIASASRRLTRIDGQTTAIDQPAVTVTDPVGAIPSFGTSSQYAQLLALYRGRLFHGRFVNSPYNYVASASGDLLDYNFSDITQKGAFQASNTQQAGLLPDILTAMVPFGDQSMVMGMTQSVSIMRGDPKAGGSIDDVSKEVGIVAPQAWCRTPDGDMLFMGRDGMYKIDGRAIRGAGTDAILQPMSRGRTDASLGSINWSLFTPIMQWDPQEQGAKIYLVPLDSSLETTVIFWDQRKNAFWRDVYPAGIGPTAAVTTRGRTSLMQVVLGCSDGHLRALDPLSKNDDGIAISSRLDYAPQWWMGPMMNAKLVQSRLLFGAEDNFNAVMSLRVGTDPVTASAADVVYSRTMTLGGYQSLDRHRERGACGIISLANSVLNKTWAIERVTLAVAPSGRQRQ